MTRKAFIKQSDMRRMAAVAKEFSIRVEVEVDGVLVRFAPDSGQQQPGNFATLSEWQAWRERRPDRLGKKAKEPVIDHKASEWRLWDPVTDPPQPIQKAFDHRESAAMKRLVKLGVGRKLHPAEVRGFGPHTQKKLADRGYLEIHAIAGQDDEVSLTKKGMADWKAQEDHDEKYWKGL